MIAPPRYAHDVAISAVAYDALFVSDLSTRLAARLHDAPVWAGDVHRAEDDTPTGVLGEDSSRLAVIVGQRLWGHDERTSADASALRARLEHDPRSVAVVSLDDDPLPEWMTPLPRRTLAHSGLNGVVDFLVESFTAQGGRPLAPLSTSVEPAADLARTWPPPPTPFLGQPRAESALRRELDAIGAVFEPLERKGPVPDARIRDVHRVPNRVIACLFDVAVSFSWMPGRPSAVADGRLMVIEWSGISSAKGPDALRQATAVRERVYRAEASGPDDWAWRADGADGRACSTAHLVGAWVDGAVLTEQGLSTGAA